MKTIQMIVNRVFVSSILLISTLFIIPPTFGIADGNTVTFYEYLYGLPFRWLTVTSVTEIKNNFMDTFFMGNDGVSIQWLSLAGSFLLIFLVVSIIFFLVKKLYRRKKGKI